ncbi:hypothetical protein [Lysobacter gummosus]|uniref:ATP-grasp domain-containing protein n=1 Tax=Lysobacter gummosus TaxID=262324 RepID=A0ABY3XBD3_9GAMM|nr:hypothetical protein [Lysobacter gummosus]ALN92488.1 rimK-like ATP-grasp domain protein [Lysobacter gummosus]UNP28062.1 hypothetical protein MOV92_16350 [Lysobacter gummosus]
MTTLIVADPWDQHAQAVAWALDVEGEPVHIWYTHDFPQKHHVSLRIGGDSPLSAAAPGISLYCTQHRHDFQAQDIETVWLRRWYQPAASSDLHPADTRFSQVESNEFVRSAINLLDERPRFWVNSVQAKSRADRKVVQLMNAAAVGLKTPLSLFSNDPEQIRGFFREHGGKVVYKPITGAAWVGEETSHATFTSILNEELLRNDGSLSNAPGIYQTLLDKRYELRVTVMGRTVVAAKIKSQRDGNYLTDWRANDFDENMGCERYAMPAEVEARCLALMERLGLVFGCIDIVVTTAGDYVFLEVNEMGQFLWLEGINPDLQLLDCFVRFLRSRDPRFVYDWRAPAYRYREYWETTQADGGNLPNPSRHVALPRTFEMRE